MLHRLSELQGIPVQATDGIAGIVRDLYFDPDSWTVQYVAANTGIGPHGRLVLVPVANVLGVYLYGLVGNGIAVNLTKKQIERGLTADTHPLISGLRKSLIFNNAQRVVRRVMHAGRQSPSVTTTDHHAEQPKLLNADAISCYGIDALDGEIGHVKDIMVDDNTWLIHFILISTRKWWPGKSLLIGVDHIHDVDEAESKVHLNMIRDAVRNAMKYDPYRPPYLPSRT
jgi:sporulation protein YlmC with PRC-barrel domain